MESLISYINAILLLIAIVSYLLKSYLHFKFMRKIETKKGGFSDLINVSFSSIGLRLKYIESFLPKTIREKQDDESLEKLRENVNLYLLISIVFFVLFIVSLFIMI